MSDYDRNKYYGKKKFQSHRGESGNSFNSRFFNSKNLYKPDGKETDKDAKPKNIKQPTILLKAPDRSEERSSSPKQTVKEAEPTPHIAVVTSSAHEVAASPVIKSMTKSVKLIDDGSIYTENVQDFLQENNDFLAVGVIGTQGVGKSTLLNLLVHSKVTEKMMLLDCQPFISSSTLDELMRSESKRSNVISEFLPLENSCEIQGLQHAAFFIIENMYKGHPPLAALINKLRSNLLGCTRYSLTPVQLSEKNWLVYSAKVWDHVKKSSFFVEYTKLMP
ncbi:hypothetical protein MML48_4g00008964 [Holotrichia oblita]|uniref:Uncharacterized protein n=1 Tax=Holotrichia oblita TaxID=644536 RepID=A0ACB9TAH0_HOLOL|nr:hypothetical protein MML48_4g00008964 [Holotrichia oblita]